MQSLYKPKGELTPDLAAKQIIFFDGHCSICSLAVDFILPRAKEKQFHFAPLSGSTAAFTLPDDLTKTPFTIVLLKNSKIFIESDAALEIALGLNSPWNLLSNLRVLPKSLRDLGYKFIAFIRYKVLPKRETCKIPRPEYRDLFLP